MSRRQKATRSGVIDAYDALTLAFERHEALTLLLQTHLETFDRDRCDDDQIYEEIFAMSVLGAVLLEQIKAIRVQGRVLWAAAKAEQGHTR